MKRSIRVEDNAIIELFWNRDDRAVSQTAEKYGAYCMKISQNILNNFSDSEENVNDTYLKAWNSIPPTRPKILSAYLGRIARNLALNKYKARHAEKRAGDEFSVSLDELSQCTPSGVSVEDEVQIKKLGQTINRFLSEQKEDVRAVFVCRYFNCDSIEEISAKSGFSQSKIKSVLMRTRMKLRLYLEKEGYYEE